MSTGASVLRERADRVPIAAITAGVALAAIPFLTPLPLPMLVAVWITSLALRSIAPVHQHCHSHHAIFQASWANALYDAVLMLAAGNTTSIWEHQHVRGHHQNYLERDGDPANNDRFGKHRRFTFTVLGDAMSTIDSFRLSTPRTRPRLTRQLLGQLAILVGLLVVDPVLAITFVVVPWVLLRWFIFWFSYAQHHDVPMEDVYSGSVTHFHWTNRFYLNVGHHTAHHEKPTLHWSKLPARTSFILERIPARCLR
ncbi:MAG TPA: fatty acid desaturase [Kofleriaceae bacterium]|jgi:fatty acid desaturase